MLDREEVRRVAHLARLQLTPEAETQMATQLSSILEYFEQLSELDTTDVTPMARPIDASNVVRSDALAPFADREAMLECAPQREDDYLQVPQILSVEE